jgi:UvrD-like helicase C-terminal domain
VELPYDLGAKPLKSALITKCAVLPKAHFVPSEDDVTPVAAALGAALTEQNVRDVPCPNGQFVGQNNEVRVFDIQHIKGLEFEAVFFVALDRLAEARSELFPRYLYVGATRAATYLGITCEGSLPKVIESLRPIFATNWGTI